MAAGCFLLATLALFWRPQAGFSLAMLDVGQGDCLVLREGRHVFLVDGGSTNVSEVGKYRIIPYLKSQGISRIDGIFVTHGDEDHISGIRELLGDIAEGRCAIRVDALLLPRWMRTEAAGLDAAAAGVGAAQTITERTDETDLAAAAGAGAAQTITERTDETDLAAAAAGAGAAVRYLQTGDEIAAGELAFRVLAPAAGGEALSGNEGSLVLHVRRGTFDMLLTGDLEGAGEEAVLPLIEDTDLLKVAHHGSRNATTARFLLRAKPEICLVSAPDGGRYGHPHKETLERIAETGADCYITRDCGAITVRTAGDAVYIEP